MVKAKRKWRTVLGVVVAPMMVGGALLVAMGMALLVLGDTVRGERL